MGKIFNWGLAVFCANCEYFCLWLSVSLIAVGPQIRPARFTCLERLVGLFLDGLRFAVVWLVFWLLPILLASLIALLMPFVYLGALSSIFFLTSVLLSTVLFSSALYRYNMRRNFKDLLDLLLIFRMTGMEMPRLILPGFAFLGFLVLLQPFYGFAIFGGFLVLITYTSLRFRSIEGNPSVSF